MPHVIIRNHQHAFQIINFLEKGCQLCLSSVLFVAALLNLFVVPFVIENVMSI